MVKRLSLRWKLYWVLFALMMTIYLVMILWSLPKISAIAGGLAPFDMRPSGYSFEDARAIFSAISAEGREFYLNIQQSLDTIYPALVGIVLVGGLIGLDRGGWGWVLSLFAIAGSLFDYIENASVRLMLLTDLESITEEMVADASSWTILKSLCHTIAMGGLLIFLLISLYRWFFKQRVKDVKPIAENEENPEAKASEK